MDNERKRKRSIGVMSFWLLFISVFGSVANIVHSAVVFNNNPDAHPAVLNDILFISCLFLFLALFVLALYNVFRLRQLRY